MWWGKRSPDSGGTNPGCTGGPPTSRRFEGASLASSAVHALALALDSVLADTRPLWQDWLDDAARRTHVVLDVPNDRIEAAALLDERLGDWRPLLERFAADRGPVYFRPHGDTGTFSAASRPRARGSASSRTRRASSPTSLAGASRRVEVVGTLDEVLAALGDGATVVHTRDELGAAAAVYHSEHGAH